MNALCKYFSICLLNTVHIYLRVANNTLRILAENYNVSVKLKKKTFRADNVVIT